MGFQPGEGPSRGLLCDYEPSDGPSFQALSPDHLTASTRTRDVLSLKYKTLTVFMITTPRYVRDHLTQNTATDCRSSAIKYIQ